MQISRRQMVGAGAAAGTLALIAGSPLLAQVVGTAAPAKAAAAPVPAHPRVIVDPVVDPRIVARARASFEKHRAQLIRTDVVGIADFSRLSAEPRFHLLDTSTGKVTTHLVTHGRGSDPGHTGLLQRFSNEPGSLASSDGGYLVGDVYYGKYGRSLRLKGLDPTNDNAEARAIVVHTAWYAEPGVVAQQGRLGRSEGCFAFPAVSHHEVLARLGPGRFLYADRV